MPHDTWADHYDKVYELTYGKTYETFTAHSLQSIKGLRRPPARIVDYGAGTGRLAIPLAQAGYHVTAVDASREMCRVLREKAERAGVRISVVNQSICEPLEEAHFDMGICVFTVLNYIVNEAELRNFSTSCSKALKSDAALLVSLVKNMAAMQDFYNQRPETGSSPDRKSRVTRNINISAVEGPLYKYKEKTELTIRGKTHHYRDEIELRQWSKHAVTKELNAAGFTLETDSHIFGDHYLTFRRSSFVTK
jgi:2-polyprenyl-3-methyl-5-hydroxy-6-metoxy-1,4-benzoquinol methylase